jgi:hypothetical protein
MAVDTTVLFPYVFAQLDRLRQPFLVGRNIHHVKMAVDSQSGEDDKKE